MSISALIIILTIFYGSGAIIQANDTSDIEDSLQSGNWVESPL